MAKKTPKDIEYNIHNPSICYEEILEFIRLLSSTELHNSDDTRIKFELIVWLTNGDTFNFESANEFFDNEHERFLEDIKKNKIKRLTITNYKHFKLSVGGIYSTISYQSDSALGHYLTEQASEILTLHKSKSPHWSGMGVMGIPIYALVSFAIYSSNAHKESQLIAFVSAFLYIVFANMIGKAKIKMGNKHDSLFYRKKDDIIISAISLLVGFMLGRIS